MSGRKDDLMRFKQPNIRDGQFVEHDEDDMIANEFSDDEELQNEGKITILTI